MACEIDLRALQKVTNAIFDHIIKDLKVEKVELKDDADFYWEVPSNRLHAVEDQQPQLDVGRLSDDWGFLSKGLEDPQGAVALLLIHVGPLLSHIGEEVGQ
jgi:hypothetical protein